MLEKEIELSLLSFSYVKSHLDLNHSIIEQSVLFEKSFIPYYIMWHNNHYETFQNISIFYIHCFPRKQYNGNRYVSIKFQWKSIFLLLMILSEERLFVNLKEIDEFYVCHCLTYDL